MSSVPLSQLQKNLIALEGRVVGLSDVLAEPLPDSMRWKKSRSGKKNLLINGIAVHDRLDPEKDWTPIRSWETRDCHVHIGLGLGYGLELESLHDRTELLVFEPDLALLHATLVHVPLKRFGPSKSMQLFCREKDFLEAVFSRIDRGANTNVLALPFHRRMHAPCLKRVLRQIADRVQMQHFQRQTWSNRIGQILRSTMQSLPLALTCQPFDRLRGSFAGMPAVIASSGPSLEKNLADLMPFRDQVILVAISRSVKSLLQMGLVPDFMVHIEFQDIPDLIQDRDALRQTRFLLPYQAHWRFFQFPSQAVYLYQTPYNPVVEWLVESCPSLTQSQIETGGSVAHDAMSLSLAMGCEPVILLGQDLALEPGVEGLKQEETEDLKSIPGYFGKPVFSPGNYRRFLSWFSSSLGKGEVYNATEGGALIPGFKCLALKDLLQRQSPSSQGESGKPLNSEWVNRSEVRVACQRILGQLNEMSVCNSHYLKALDSGEDSRVIESLENHFQGLVKAIPFFQDCIQTSLREAQVMSRAEPWRKSLAVVQKESLLVACWLMADFKQLEQSIMED